MITVVGSLKGGSGKSTLTFNLAVWLGLAGRQPLVLDLDPQATLTDVAEVRAEEAYEPLLQPQSSIKPKQLKQYDGEVLIDVGTADMDALKQAVAIADRIVVPVPPSQADIWSTQRFLKIVDEACGGNPPQVLGFINRADTHHAVRETDEAAAALVVLPGIEFLRPRLGQRTGFRRSFSEGLAVFELDPKSKASRELLALSVALYPELVR